MPKQKRDYDKIKMEFMLSDFDEVKSYITHKWIIYNAECTRRTKWWTKEKQEYKQKIYEKALKKKWNETAKEISDIAKRYEMLDEEFISWMERQFEEERKTPKKGEKKRRLFSNDIMNMRKISRSERWLPTSYSKVEQTNKDESWELNEDEKEAFKTLKKMKK